MEDPLVVHKRLLADYERVCAENAKLKERGVKHHAEAAKFLATQAALKEQVKILKAKNAKLKEVLKKIKVRLLAHGEWLD